MSQAKSNLLARVKPSQAAPPTNQEKLLSLVGYNCRQVTMFMGPRFAKRMHKLGILRMEFAVLMLVRDNDQINQKRLAEIMHVAPSNLNLVLDRLESVGWVMRYRNPLDKRSQFLKLTLRGTRKCESAEKAGVEVENEATAVLSDEERAELVRLLKKIHLQEEAA